jgi:hypothetical protein
MHLRACDHSGVSRSGDQHVRLTSRDALCWIELAQLRPPGATGKPRRGAGGDFWGSVTLHTAEDQIRGYVGWNDAYARWFAEYLADIGGSATGWSGEKVHETEDLDLTMGVRYDGSAPASVTATVLDWWDPYKPSGGGYPGQRELTATFEVVYSDLQTFTRRAVRLLSTD